MILGDNGDCHLVLIRGLGRDKKKPEGDAEQQALIKAGKDDGKGGEVELGAARIVNIGPKQWHNLKLRFQGAAITGLVDGTLVLTAENTLYARGMAGLRAGGGKKTLSTPYFDNVLINALNAPLPKPSLAAPGQSPMYINSPR